MFIPPGVFQKAGELPEQEMGLFRLHTIQGCKMLSPDWFYAAAALLHHERWDGTGYPLGYNGSRA